MEVTCIGVNLGHLFGRCIGYDGIGVANMGDVIDTVQVSFAGFVDHVLSLALYHF